MSIHTERATDGKDIGILHDSHCPIMRGKDLLYLSPGSPRPNRNGLIGIVVAHSIQVGHIQVQRVQPKRLSTHAVSDAREGNFSPASVCISYGLDDLGHSLW